jgi:lipoate-protein ligase B
MSVTPYQQSAGNLLDLDRQDYNEVLDLQHRLVSLRARNQIPDTLIMVEHPHIFTVGKAVPDEVSSQIDGVPVVRIERGGQWTYHGPGQLVGYPILDLNARGRDIHRFLWSMEETLVRTLEEFGIIAGRVEGRGKTGVWIGKKKIASIGAAVRNWITFHGFALNVNTDMHYFDLIDPCGMPSSTMTSMKTIIDVHVDFDKVKNSVKRNFEDVFHVSLRTIDAQMLENAGSASDYAFLME